MTAIPRGPDPAPAHPVDTILIDAARLAVMLGCSTRHVERLDSAGKLPAPVRIGRAKRWNVDEVRAWIAAGCPPRRIWEARRALGGRG